MLDHDTENELRKGRRDMSMDLDMMRRVAELSRISSRDGSRMVNEYMQDPRMRERMAPSHESDALRQAKQTIEAQNKELERLAEESTDIALVVHVGDDVVVAQQGTFKVCRKPEFELAVGDHVVVYDTGQILRKVSFALGGNIAEVVEIGEVLTISINGQKHAVPPVTFAVKKGDKVVTDKTNTVAISRYEEARKPVNPPKVTWDDIKGLDEAKTSMREAVELPVTHADMFKHYGKKPSKGILLYGAAGCGKTLLGKAAANSISDKADGFTYIKGPELLSKWVGESEEQIRQLFAKARLFKAEHGVPMVIFIDEAEALLAKRGGDGIVSSMSGTIVPAFLTEMDGLEDSAAIVILATNRHDILDPAITREGRIDRKIRITRPSAESGYEIILGNLQKAPFKGKLETLARTAAESFYSADRVLYRIDLKSGEHVNFTMAEIVNGAMLAEVVERAKILAMRRDMETKKMTGITENDLLTAVEDIMVQNLEMNHTDDVNLFTETFKDQVKDIVQVR